MTYFLVDFHNGSLSDLNDMYLRERGFADISRTAYKSALNQVNTILTLMSMPDKQPLRYAKMYRVEEETSLAPLVGFYDE